MSTLLKDTILEIFKNSRGILATDATEDTMDKRMSDVGIVPTPELRVRFREILLTTPGISEFIGGVILNDEIISSEISGGISFVELLSQQGIKVGIKVDRKTHDFANFPGEKIAEGLDGLRDRFKKYKDLGASFSKFRAVIRIGEGIPTQACIESNAEVLARYAALSQESEIVPIVEPEVVMDGSHPMERCMQVTSAVLQNVFFYLQKHRVDISGMILKSNMILPGKDSGMDVSDKEVAITTLEVLKRKVPEILPVVVFLSGGQSPVSATSRLNEMAKIGGFPWKISFSYERALEGPSLEIWKGLESNVDLARNEFLKRARLNSLALAGRYDLQMERDNS